MRSNARLLPVVPLGVLATSFLFDIVFLVSGNTTLATISFWMIALGVVGGLMATQVALRDFLVIKPGTRARRLAGVHGFGNAAVVGMFAMSWALRFDTILPATGALAASGLGVALVVITNYFGSELVDEGVPLAKPVS